MLAQTVILSLVTLASLAYAAAGDFPAIGFGGPIVDISTGSATPNITHSVTFDLDSGYDYTWRINTSDTAGSDQSSQVLHGDGRVLTTSYDFQWQGGETLNATLHNETLCATVVTSFLPANVTNAYRSNDGSNFTNAIGETCLNAIMRSLGPASQNGKSCPATFINNIPACNGTFGRPYGTVAGGKREASCWSRCAC